MDFKKPLKATSAINFSAWNRNSWHENLPSKIKDKKIALVGYDLLENNIEYLNNKAIDFLIHQNPKRQAYLGITSLIEYFIFDKEITAEQLLPIDIVTTENAKNYMI